MLCASRPALLQAVHAAHLTSLMCMAGWPDEKGFKGFREASGAELGRYSCRVDGLSGWLCWPPVCALVSSCIHRHQFANQQALANAGWSQDLTQSCRMHSFDADNAYFMLGIDGCLTARSPLTRDRCVRRQAPRCTMWDRCTERPPQATCTRQPPLGPYTIPGAPQHCSSCWRISQTSCSHRQQRQWSRADWTRLVGRRPGILQQQQWSRADWNREAGWRPGILQQLISYGLGCISSTQVRILSSPSTGRQMDTQE